MAALALTDSFRFGKWIGKTIRDVAVNEPGYIQFLAKSNSSMFEENVIAIANEKDKMKRVEMARVAMGSILTEQEQMDNVPFPPMCDKNDIPF